MAYNESFPLSSLLGDLTKYLPMWMRIRKDPNSVGAQFLNVFALEFEDIKKYLDQVVDDTHVQSADVTAVDILYRADCSAQNPIVAGFIGGVQVQLARVETIPDFYRSTNDVFILDFDRRLLYTKREYESLYIDNIKVPLYIHHVWNHFDEFGLLLDVPRLHGEKNADYKERLLSVFRLPANATRKGVMNGVSRHLGLLKSVAWEDDSKPFFFASPDITLDKIWIDWQPVDEEVCSINDGLVRIDPFSVEGSGMPRSIQYVDSLVMYQLWDKELKNLFYFDDGTARPKLKYIASTIQKEVPIMWDEFVWDEAYWDVVERSMNGINYIPNIWDADINAWRPDGQRIDREEESKYGVFDKSKWDSGAKWK